MSPSWITCGSLLGGVAAAIGASACCAGPLLFVLLGVGSAWGSRLGVLAVYQAHFMWAALAFFGYAFVRLYRKPDVCGPGEVCATPTGRRRQRIIFWVVAAAASALMSLPLYAPLLY